MTQEEKAKRYDSMFERLKEMYNNNKTNVAARLICERYFPELKESDDEKIRKALVEMVHDTTGDSLWIDYNVHKEDALAWLEKQGEQKPADKVEPKFKAGDWIVFNGFTLYVKEVVKGYYRTISKGGIPNSYDWDIDNVARLWTIQDAKDGDVLNSPTHYLIWIYKDNEHYHACVNMNYVTENVFTDGLIIIPNDACPATNDERTILLSNLEESGYEWNAEKKELLKIEQKKGI